MSSNIRIQRICQHCGKEYTARTTVSKTCSDYCSKRAYKERARAEKVLASDNETRIFRQIPFKELKEREYLTVRQVSKVLGCSRQNIYKIIKAGRLKATNILTKKTLVKKSDLDRLFS